MVLIECKHKIYKIEDISHFFILVVNFARLVVIMEHLVVILRALVVKITALVVIVKLWNKNEGCH